jgi:hypothetical protein
MTSGHSLQTFFLNHAPIADLPAGDFRQALPWDHYRYLQKMTDLFLDAWVFPPVNDERKKVADPSTELHRWRLRFSRLEYCSARAQENRTYSESVPWRSKGANVTVKPSLFRTEPQPFH